MKFWLPLHSVPVNAFLDIFSNVIRSGRTIGKLRIAISEKLLLALEAMAAIMVSIEANPKLPKISAVRKSGILTTAFPIRVRKRIKERDERIAINNRLYNTFDSKTAWGLAIV